MYRIARNILFIVGALLLMLLLSIAAVILGNTNPSIHTGWFLAGAGIAYTMIILMFLHRE